MSRILCYLVLPAGFGFAQPHATSTTKNVTTGQGERHHHCPGVDCLLPAALPQPLGRGAGVSGPFFSPLAQAGQLLGLSPNGGAGQGERGEGRRLEGRSSAGLAALGSKRGGCSVWLLRAFPLLPPHLLASRDGCRGARGVCAGAERRGEGCDHQQGTEFGSSTQGWVVQQLQGVLSVPSLHPLVPKQLGVFTPLGHIPCVAHFLQRC